MSLKPNLNKYLWNEYYFILAVAMLPAVSNEFSGILPEVIIRGINVITVGAIATLAWMREPTRKVDQ